jgi:hypothetical protein
MLKKKPGFVAFAMLACLLVVSQVSAQSGVSASITQPDTSRFPQIDFYLDVRDDSGNFVSGLAPGDIQVLENGQIVPVDSLEEIDPGAQLVVALNPGRPFAIRDAQGNSRYDFVRQSLEGWAGQAAGYDRYDLSLLATNAPESTHLSDPGDWLTRLEAFQPDMRAATPGVEVLVRALDVAVDAPPRLGMGHGVLFITAPLDPSAATVLESQAARAAENGVRIFVWMVGSQNLFSSPEAELLQNLAASTQGEYYAFSGTEAFPDIEAYLRPLRSTYHAAYTSGLIGGENINLSVGVRVGGTEIISPPQTFSLAIASPNPIFLSPPDVIERTIPAGGDLEPEALAPKSQAFEILVEFPDGHERALQSTTLYVNDEAVDVNTVPPFDEFEWDLSQVLDVGAYTLRVEAVDVLGLSGSSVNTPIRIEIVQPAQDAVGVLSRNGTLLAAAAIIMAGGVLFLILIMGGRLRPRGAVAARPNGASPNRKTRPASSRRPTQPAKTRRMMAMTAELPGTLARSKTRAKVEPKAYLTWLNGSGNGKGKAEPVPVRDRDVIFGTDSRGASLQLDDPSVERVHARLRQKRDGTFELRDEGSVAGTWVNYAPVSRSWTRLEEGDLIHVGKVGFRFHSSTPTRPRQTKVTHGGKK